MFIISLRCRRAWYYLIVRFERNRRMRVNRNSPLGPPRSNSSDWGLLALFVIGALIIGGYLLVQRRLEVAVGKPDKTRTPQVTLTPTRGIDDYIRDAQQAYLAGDLRQAINLYDQASRRRPRDLDLQVQAARLHIYIYQPAKAEQRLRKILQTNPNNLEARAVLCKAVEWQNRISEAIAECETVLAAKPDDPIAMAYLAEALIDQSVNPDIDRALTLGQKAVELLPQNEDTLRNLGYVNEMLRRYDTALDYYQRALAVNKNLPHVLISISRIYLSQGQATEAVVTLKSVLDVDDQNAEAWDRLGVTYQAQGQWDSALNAHEKATKLAPDMLRAWTNLGAAHFQKGRYILVIEDYNKAIAISQKTNESLKAWDYLNMAFAFQLIGDCDKALQTFAQVTALAPNDFLEQQQVLSKRCGK